MGNCFSSNPIRAGGDSGRANGQIDPSGNMGGVSNSVGIIPGINEATSGGDGMTHTSNNHLQHIHVRNPNSLPPLPDSENNSQV